MVSWSSAKIKSAVGTKNQVLQVIQMIQVMQASPVSPVSPVSPSSPVGPVSLAHLWVLFGFINPVIEIRGLWWFHGVLSVE